MNTIMKASKTAGKGNSFAGSGDGEGQLRWNEPVVVFDRLCGSVREYQIFTHIIPEQEHAAIHCSLLQSVAVRSEDKGS